MTRLRLAVLMVRQGDRLRVPETRVCRRFYLVVIALALCGGESRARGPATSVIYVQAAAVTGQNNGTSWADAYLDLQQALGVAVPGQTIWVGAGAYSPGTGRSDSFHLLDGVTILGGFAGTESPDTFDPTGRDFTANETILTGVLAGSGTHAYHVVIASGTTRSAVLDGFTITAGAADGISTTLQDVGGGMLIAAGSPTIRHCVFIANSSLSKGGAVHLTFASPLFVSCRFVQNETTVTQAAANFGGAVYSEGDVLPFGPPTFINCLFVGNRAGVGSGGSGGAFYLTPGNRPTLINCSLSANHADTSGGGVWGAPRIINSVLWGNTDGRGTGGSAQISGSATVTHSCIQGGWSGVGNIEEDPMFTGPAGADGVLGTRDDDLSLSSGSLAIDAGDSTVLPAEIDTDLGGDPRFVNDPTAPDTGVGGVISVVDMGAFEFQATCLVDADCVDGRVCNGVEVCVAGLCRPGTAIDCDDGVPCTADTCEEETGACLHEPIDARCDDGLFCDGVETCDAVSDCLPGAAVDCDDGVGCTVDSCDEQTAACVHIADDTRCDNGMFCDGIELCNVASGCGSAEPVSCDDGLACTTDRCDEASGACTFEPDDAACDNGIFCDGSDVCVSGVGCVSGGVPCATGICDELGSRCVACITNEDCDDAVACTADRCDAETGTCVNVPTDESCDDSDPCTTDTCGAAGCEFAAIDGCCTDDAACSDGSFCTGVQRCVGNVCTVGTAPCNAGETCDEETDTCTVPPECVIDADCADGNPCTDNTCDSGVCTVTTNADTCDDADDCTENDTCTNAACSGTPIPNCGEIRPPGDGSGGGPAPSTDQDSDGVPDGQDACPDTPASEAPNSNGCSCSQRDTDSDGVDDCLDECAGTQAGESVDASGCIVAPAADQPIPTPPEETQPPAPSVADSDSDGVADELDQCPETLAGTVVGADGCPIVSDVSVPDAADAEAPSPVRSSPCGACGTVGLIPWSLMVLGLGTLRRGIVSVRPARRPAQKSGPLPTRSR